MAFSDLSMVRLQRIMRHQEKNLCECIGESNRWAIFFTKGETWKGYHSGSFGKTDSASFLALTTGGYTIHTLPSTFLSASNQLQDSVIWTCHNWNNQSYLSPFPISPFTNNVARNIFVAIIWYNFVNVYVNWTLTNGSKGICVYNYHWYCPMPS